jgi:hypothetical protein
VESGDRAITFEGFTAAVTAMTCENATRAMENSVEVFMLMDYDGKGDW